MGMISWFLVVCAYNALLTRVVRSEWRLQGEPVKHSAVFQAGAMFGEVFLQQYLVREVFTAGYGAFFGMPLLAASGLTLAPFVIFLVSEFYDRLHHEVSNVDQMTVEPTFHQVEALMKKRDYAGAEAMLREAIEADPRCPEARSKLVEVLQARGDIDGAARELRALVPLLPAEEQKASALFRLFDLLVDHDPRGAEAAMLRVKAEFTAPYIVMACSRLRRLHAPSEA